VGARLLELVGKLGCRRPGRRVGPRPLRGCVPVPEERRDRRSSGHDQNAADDELRRRTAHQSPGPDPVPTTVKVSVATAGTSVPNG
jgi:hypothetical protein